MLLVNFIIGFLLATVILWYNPKNESLRWISAALYASSLSVLFTYFNAEISNPLLINSLYFITDAAMAYTYGMFCMTYSEFLNRASRRITNRICAVLITIVWLMTPLATIRGINYQDMNGLWMCILATICFLGGISFLIVAYYREKDRFKKIERFLTNLLIIPLMLWLYCVCYVLYFVGFELWEYSYVIAIGFLVAFFIIGVKKGVLGIKIKFEKIKVHASLGALHSSTGFINHTVKNEIGKIDILLLHLSHSIQGQAQLDRMTAANWQDTINTANQSIIHIQAMMNKIHENVQVISVSRQKESLQRITEESLVSLVKTVDADILIQRNFNSTSPVYCDSLHMKEVIQNMLSNAVEAIGLRGVITISIFERKKEVILSIQDTGEGIPKEAMLRIFEPFFSTKDMKYNYGLGLFYCNNVIMKHGGSIQVESQEGKGTVFSIILPI